MRRRIPVVAPCLLAALAALGGLAGLATTSCMSKRASAPAYRSDVSAGLGEAARGSSAAAQALPAPPAVAGKGVLIKRGTITIIVTDAAEAEAKVRSLLTELGGYVSARQSQALVPQQKYLAPSEVRSLTLTLKVDAKAFDTFLARIKEIGSYTAEQVEIEDVTFAFMDLNARLANQKRVEERLLGHLGDPNRDYKMVIEVEKELGRVREQIEQLSAQLRVMEDQIAYSTLTVQLTVMPEWVPPAERTFWQDLYDSVADSLRSLADSGRALVIVGVAAIPWLVALAFCLFVLVRLWRLVRRPRKKG
jgi:hypothetical protein